MKVGSRIKWKRKQDSPLGTVVEIFGEESYRLAKVRFDRQFSGLQDIDNCLNVWLSDCVLFDPQEELRYQEQKRREAHADRYL